ncbi:hypothetical protein HRI_001534800 [Hibiscus trionum]|uniref:40S ribosomal protein S4 n=1 Tax=Hibiscus trionum TaxID=183268 RepID=A0A9W7HMN2_HIBTR|nr:hypothetical protein HRI_001534800 [Hibiscus trionum]
MLKNVLHCFSLIIIIISSPALIVSSSTEQLSSKQCEDLGFTGLALCSDCNTFYEYVKDKELMSDCLKCCMEDSDDYVSKIKYSGAILEVCMRKLVFYPEIVGFIEEEKSKFPSVKVQYLFNSPPKLIMLDDEGQHKETIRIDNWKREHLLQFLRDKARGLKKHLKRLNAPRHWMLDKLGGAFAPKPSSGPHKSRECLPLILILRNRLKYALTYREVIAILMQRHVMVDGKVRTDKTYPAGFMDVVSIPKTNEDFRLLYDTKGRFRLHAITGDETKFKLCKVRSVQFGQKGIPYINTYDGRTIRYPDPLIKANDTIKLDLESNKIVDFIKFDVGNVVMVTGGRNRGRVGVIKNREKHKGSFETIHVQDAAGHEFATRLGNVFTIGKGTKPWVSLPKGKGIKLSIIEEARKRLAAQASV